MADAGNGTTLAPAPPAPSVVERLERRPWWLRAAILGLLPMPFLLIGTWAVQIDRGIGIAGIHRPVFWGFFIVNFVFFIGISHAGTLISAILRVTGASWRRPLVRCAELVTVLALAIGALFPIIHLGRPLLFYVMLPYPNARGLWPNIRSPLIWDLAAIGTYLTGSVLYLLLPMLPDVALWRDRARGLRRRLLAFLACGWRGTPRQWQALEAGIAILAVVIIPVAVSVHTIVSWDFSMTRVPGWQSTIFGPYFVVGAIYSGIAVLLLAMVVLRRGFALADTLTDRVFDRLGLLFLAMTMLWGYFTFAEHLTTWYGGDAAAARVHESLVHGRFAPLFWTMVVCNFVVPFAVLPFPRGRRPLGTAIAATTVVIGMWLERFLIVVPSLSYPRVGSIVGTYAPRASEILIMIGAFGSFAFMYLLFVYTLPAAAIWELREGEHEHRHGAAPPREQNAPPPAASLGARW